MDTKIEEAWEQFKKPWSFGEDREWAAKQFFEFGWKANPAKWTDEDLHAAFNAGASNETLVETGIGMYPEHRYNFSEWLEEYKQSKQK